MITLEIAERKHPIEPGTVGDWRRFIKREQALFFELKNYRLSEAVPVGRRPVRARAKAIIEGRAPWPAELLPWKLYAELAWRVDPPWLDSDNLTRPQRERLAAKEAAIDVKLAKIAARERRAAAEALPSVFRVNKRDFYWARDI